MVLGEAPPLEMWEPKTWAALQALVPLGEIGAVMIARHRVQEEKIAGLEVQEKGVQLGAGAMRGRTKVVGSGTHVWGRDVWVAAVREWEAGVEGAGVA